MRPDRHEHGSVLQQPPLSASTFCYRNHRSPGPHSVTSPSELYIDCSPCSPVRGVISCGSLESFIGKFVAEVICDVPEIVCLETKCFCRFNTGKCCRGGREAVDEWTAETPWEQLVTQEASWFKHTSCHHAFAKTLATLYTPTNNEHHPLHRVSFSDYLCHGIAKKMNSFAVNRLVKWYINIVEVLPSHL